MNRREFIKKSALATGVLCLPGALKPGHAATAAPATTSNTGPLVVKVTGESPYNIAKKAVESLGGMKKFISKQDIVMIKPNIGWNRSVELAANTNPEVVKALVEMAFNAGAKKVIVMDNPCHKAEDTYSRSGIEAAAKAAGAEVRYTDENRLVVHDFKGESLTRWPVFKDFLEVDKFINVPILKHHGSAGLTIGMKNLYGILGGERGKLHRDMGMGIADLAYGIKPHLTIVDAYRILLRNGPVGGRASDVELKKTIIASSNIFEADVVAANLFGMDPMRLEFIQYGADKKMGNTDISKINLKTFTA